MDTPVIVSGQPDPPRWAIVQWDASTGLVNLILWAPTSAIVDEATQEAMMIRHPQILKAWRLEEIK